METPRILRWEALTKRQFDAIDRERAVVLLTCSPLEVHGPHLPLGADALEGEGLTERMLRFLPERHRDRPFLKLPMIFAATDVVPQPGSLHFQPSTTVTVLTDLGRTLAAQGFRRVMIGNFHGGPRHFLAIEKACRRVQRKHGLEMISLFSLMIARFTNGTSSLDDVLGGVPGVDRADLVGDTHGGVVETSQLLALHGDWVDPDYESLPRTTVETWLEAKGEARPDGQRGDPSKLLGMLRSYRSGIHYFLDETYSGAPASASPELGERFLDLLGEKAAEGVTELLDGAIGPEDCHSPIWKLRFLFLNPLMIRLSDRWMGFRNPIA
jgi:creatinine amidohydrolase